MKKKLLIIIFFELFLLGFIYAKDVFYRQKMHEVHINLISKDQVISTSSGILKYFYEPKPATTYEIDLSWMGNAYHYKVQYHINSEGFNQLQNVSEEKPNDVFRIITLGDSFTFGDNVDTKDNYPSQLQEILNRDCESNKKFQVINLGVYGYDLQYTVERFRLKGKKYKPDLIVWHIIGDDFVRVNESLMPLVEKINLGSKRANEHTISLEKTNPDPVWSEAKSESVKRLGGEKKVLIAQKRNIEEIYRYIDNPLVFTMPSNYSTKYKEVLEKIEKSHKNTYLNSGIRNIYAENAYLPDMHPNREGNRTIAEDTFNYLKKMQLIQCH